VSQRKSEKGRRVGERGEGRGREEASVSFFSFFFFCFSKFLFFLFKSATILGLLLVLQPNVIESFYELRFKLKKRGCYICNLHLSSFIQPWKPWGRKKPLVAKAVLISAAGSQDAQSLANGRKVELGKSAKRIWNFGKKIGWGGALEQNRFVFGSLFAKGARPRIG